MPAKFYVSTDGESEFAVGLKAAAKAADDQKHIYFVYGNMRFERDPFGYYVTISELPLVDPDFGGAATARVTITDLVDKDGPKEGLYERDGAAGHVDAVTMVYREDGKIADRWTRYTILVTATTRDVAISLYSDIRAEKIEPVATFGLYTAQVNI